MSTFRKSGSFVAFTWSGKLPGFRDWSECLAKQRFRSIDTAASEEVSVGWVTPADPTGDSFDVEDRECGNGFWLRFRTDTKKMPQSLVAQHIAVAEKHRGRRLSGRERRELKADLAEKTLPRVLPKSTNTDVLVFVDQGARVLLFSASKAAREALAGLWFRSFGVPLEPLGPLQMALLDVPVDLGVKVAKLEPTRWGKGVA